jgi:hypothetical protein
MEYRRRNATGVFADYFQPWVLRIQFNLCKVNVAYGSRRQVESRRQVYLVRVLRQKHACPDAIQSRRDLAEVEPGRGSPSLNWS